MAAIIRDLRAELGRLKSRGIVRVTLNPSVTLRTGDDGMLPTADLVVVYLCGASWKTRDAWMNVWTVSSLGADVQGLLLASLV